MNNDNHHKYDDIINMPHHVSRRHKQMPLSDRAAQFSPFSALSGYGDAVKETARQTDGRIYLSEDAKAVINDKIRILSKMSHSESVSITYFVPDDKKAGGQYITDTETVKKIDEYNKVIKMNNGAIIAFKDILELDGDIFNSLYE